MNEKKATVYKNISKILVPVLMLIALEVFIGKAFRADMWVSIAVYWLAVAIKNFCDWRGSKN